MKEQLEVIEQKRGMVNIEDQAMSIDSLLGQVKLIQEVMKKIMKENEHYGTIPGTKKPTLLKPGAEKLCLTFRLDPDYQIVREVREKDFIAYTMKCDLIHILTGQKIASGIGSCNSRETKYRYRYTEESTGVPVPKKYWEAREKGDNKEMKRVLQVPDVSGELRASKVDGQWMIVKAEKIENDNPWDLDNTLIKMACKRALIAASLNATAASDIFTQDLDDDDLKNTMDKKLNGDQKKTSGTTNKTSKVKKNTKVDCPDMNQKVAQIYCEKECDKFKTCAVWNKKSSKTDTDTPEWKREGDQNTDYESQILNKYTDLGLEKKVIFGIAGAPPFHCLDVNKIPEGERESFEKALDKEVDALNDK